MRRAAFALPLLMLPLLASTAVLARSTGDMFYDESYTIYKGPERGSPEVLSPARDMFPRATPFETNDTDLFGRMQRPGDVYIEDRFSAHAPFIPYDPLYIWPPEAPFP